jgi:hypothetical protein
LDGIEAALITSTPDALTSLCHQLQQMLQDGARGLAHADWSQPNDRAAAQAIERRIASLRSTLLQQGASAGRALATLLPDRALGAYGGKSGFTSSARGPHVKSYRA